MNDSIVYKPEILKALSNYIDSLENPNDTMFHIPPFNREVSYNDLRAEINNRTSFGMELYKVLENMYDLDPDYLKPVKT